MTALAFVVVFLSIVANGFFAGVETGFTSARRARLLHWARLGRRGAAGAAAMASDRESAVVAAVVGNNVTSSAGTQIANLAAQQLIGPSGEIVAGIVMSSLNTVFGEILPKTAYRARPERLLLVSAPILRVTDLILAPLRIAAVALARGVLWVLRVKENDDSALLSRESLLRTFALSREHERLGDEETRLLRSFIRHSHRSIAEVLTPIEGVAHVGPQARVQDVMDRVRATGHSRLPVLGDRGEVLGLLLFRDLQDLDREESAMSQMRDVVRLSASMGLDEGIGALAERSASLAVVVDDEGVLRGIVTLEDLLEPLVGDILDEHDAPKRSPAL